MKGGKQVVVSVLIGAFVVFCLLADLFLPGSGAGFSLRAGPPPPSLVLTRLETSSGSNEYAFSVSGLPPVSGPHASVRIFLDHGDGTFFVGTPDELRSHRHQYSSRLNAYTPYGEAIPLYDDDENPSSYGSAPPIGNTGAFPANVAYSKPVIDPNKPILLQKTCDAVAGDRITYIVTYELPMSASCAATEGYLKFRFDSTHLQYLSTRSYYPGEEGNPIVASIPDPGTVFVSFNNLVKGQQRTIYFSLETKSSATDTNYVLIPPTVEVAYKNNCFATPVFRDTIFGQKIRSSHDPNYKTPWALETEPDGSITSVTWRVDFQNEGNALEDSVTVVDWIDTLFLLNSVEVIDASFAVDHFYTDRAQRKCTFVMDDVQLRGLGERGVDLEDTRGYLVLKARVRQQHFCNAFVNYARIHFGCKPPIYTDPAIVLTTGCEGAPPPASCATLLDTLLAERVITPGDSIFPAGVFSPAIRNKLIAAQGAGQLRWYPADGLSNPFIINPQVISPLARTYVLVASPLGATCERLIVRMPVGPQSRPTIGVQTVATNCPSVNPLWDVTATAGGVAPQYLLWHDCKSGATPWKQTGQSAPHTVYVGVWDTLTTCSAEEWIVLPTRCTVKPGGGVLSDILTGAGVVLALVLSFLLYRFFKKR